jgi:hypothetical protein
MGRLFAAVVLGTFLSACTAISTYTLQDGKTGYEAYCSAFSPQQCADRAAQQCPQGYVVLLNPQVQSQSAYKLVRNADDGGNRLDFSCKQ